MRLPLLAAVLAAVPALADTGFNGLTVQNVPMTNPGGGAHSPGGVTDLRFLPDGRMIFTEKNGAVKIRDTAGVVRVAYRFCVDINSEKGALGVEVDPNFNGTTNSRLFFYYSNCNGDGGTNTFRHRVVSINLLPTGLLDPTSERVLLQGLYGPANHDGGGLAISKDGQYLYVGVGDTGCNTACCPASNMYATCLSNGNGKIHRIALDGAIPNDNPLIGTAMVAACGPGPNGCNTPIVQTTTAPPRTEIWAWGFRNPWRITIDPVTGFLWAGDVGEQAREEIDIVQKGKHFGYPWYEGFMGDTAYTASQCNTVTPGSGDCTMPIWDCNHGTNCQSITGGEFIDSALFPANRRGYWFADNAQGSSWLLHVNAARDGIVDGGTNANAAEVLGVFNSPVNIYPSVVRRGPDGMPYFGMIDIMNVNATTGAGRIARVVSPGYDGGFPGGTGGGAGGGGGTGGGAGGGTAGGGTGGGTAGSGTGGGTAGSGTGGGTAGSGTGGGTAGSGTGGGTAGSGTGGGTAGSGTGGGTSGTGGGTAGGDVMTGGCHCSSVDPSFAVLGLLGVTALRRRRMMRRP